MSWWKLLPVCMRLIWFQGEIGWFRAIGMLEIQMSDYDVAVHFSVHRHTTQALWMLFGQFEHMRQASCRMSLVCVMQLFHYKYFSDAGFFSSSIETYINICFCCGALYIDERSQVFNYLTRVRNDVFLGVCLYVICTHFEMALGAIFCLSAALTQTHVVYSTLSRVDMTPRGNMS